MILSDISNLSKTSKKIDNLNLNDKTKVTESQVMAKLGIYKVYDCGKIKF